MQLGPDDLNSKCTPSVLNTQVKVVISSYTNHLTTWNVALETSLQYLSVHVHIVCSKSEGSVDVLSTHCSMPHSLTKSNSMHTYGSLWQPWMMIKLAEKGSRTSLQLTNSTCFVSSSQKGQRDLPRDSIKACAKCMQRHHIKDTLLEDQSFCD